MSRHSVFAFIFSVLATSAAPGPVVAQTRPMPLPVPGNAEAIIYRDINYTGPAVAIQSEEPDLGLAWRVKSIRVPQGEWQLCSQPNYRGTCVTVNQDRTRLGVFGAGLVVQSARYTGGNWGGGNVGNGGESLRGMMSQYFSLPMRYGREVQACNRGSATVACAERTANAFCVDMGWRMSVYQKMETRNGQVVLRDVLCSNTAG